MKRNACFALISICCLLSVLSAGCATVKETAKGLAGISTQVLEEKRKDALRESFAMDYDSCYAKVKSILKEKIMVKEDEKEVESQSWIYADDPEKKMIAIYLSEVDTTPVGIFFIDEGQARTLIEISSPSTYAKENIADRIFNGIKATLKPDNQEKKPDAK